MASLEPDHHSVQWMAPNGLPIERDDLGNTGHGVLALHPETGWHLIKSGSPISIARLGCE